MIELLSYASINSSCYHPPPPPGQTPGICKAQCPGGGDFVQQRVAPGVGGGDNLTDCQIHAIARSVKNNEDFAGKPNTFVGNSGKARYWKVEDFV